MSGDPRGDLPDEPPAESTAVGATARLARFVTDCDADDLPAEAVDAAGRSMADTLAAVVAGADTEAVRNVRRAVGRYGAGPGSANDTDGSVATGAVVPVGDRLPAPFAALVTGTAAHALELDDGHRQASAHPGAVVVPTVLALAERVDPDGAALTEATVVGYEAMVAAAAAVMPSHRERGFHATATAGCFGAAAAAAKLLDLDAPATRDALGLAGTQAGGLFEFLADGSMAKRVHPGRAAMAGVVAADMAAEGVTGPGSVLEGDDGFVAAFAEDGDLAPFEALGDPYAITETYRKPYACCRHIHGPIDAVLDVREEVAFEDVERVRVETYTGAAHHDGTAVSTVLDAQMSLPYGVAVAFLEGRPALDAFAPPRTDEPISSLMDRVTVVATEEMDDRYAAERPARTTVETVNGEVLERDVAFPTGAAENPMSRTELRGKYDALTGPVPPAVRDRAFETALSLPAATDAAPFLALLEATATEEQREKSM